MAEGDADIILKDDDEFESDEEGDRKRLLCFFSVIIVLCVGPPRRFCVRYQVSE